MKRSEINETIEGAIELFKSMKLSLPPFAYWSPEIWEKKGSECDEIRKTEIGWDVTDFGLNDFRKVGRTIFVLRNGLAVDERYKKQYCQKAMYLLEGQKSPIHYHKKKLEDIINQGPGNVLITFWRVSKDNDLSKDTVDITIDGMHRRIQAGEEIRLTPGESVFCDNNIYHEFWAEEGCGNTLSLEVSSMSDDHRDNFWLLSGDRFPRIEEDEKPKHLLCTEYS